LIFNDGHLFSTGKERGKTMTQLKLNEGERLALIAALGITTITTPNKTFNGSRMRLMKKIFKSLCLS